MKNLEKTPIIILHGWKLQGNTYKKLTELLRKKGHDVFSWDLPGFGQEELPSESFTLSDYVNFVVKKMDKEKIGKAIFIGHSFGGRVVLLLSSKHPSRVEKIILTGVPVIRNTSLVKQVQFRTAKIGKSFLSIMPVFVGEFFRKVLYYLIGEYDYYNAGRLKTVFKNTTSVDLLPYFKNATVPVICVWGVEDAIVPISVMNKMQKIKPENAYVRLEGLGHSPLRDNPEIYYNAIENYL